MGAGDQTRRLRTCPLSESYLDVSGVSYHGNCTCLMPSQSLHQLEQSPDDMQGPEFVSIPVRVHQLDSIGNETRQTRQLVSSHQQSKVGVDRPRRGVKLCVVQSARVYEWAFGSESPYG
ncbi:uncharacterized protein TNCT_1911 [Trichonephila clavata]|uniref:Uncharacterized protein n=1 Tax=Trichonephila clavata TaxID=2740835 RepID=A0A8X6F280_TRICU|nr:uncharacterized protein TNCT_1911 [Trichonephila clavata]